MGHSTCRLYSSSVRALGILATALIACRPCQGDSRAKDLAVVPLFDGERQELLSHWGGGIGIGNMRRLSLDSRSPHSGRHALCAELGDAGPGEFRFLQFFASGFGRNGLYQQSRDVTRYERLRFDVRNATGAPLDCSVQFKDYRDDFDQAAEHRFSLPAEPQWIRFDIPLSMVDAGWIVRGRPELSRTLTLDFIFRPQQPVASGQVHLDNIVFVEPGSPVDVETAGLRTLVERIARRQWDALWAARSRRHGMIPNTSYQSTDAGLNATATVLWMLPAAVRRGWVAQREANAYVEQLVATMDRLLDRARYVPPRNTDWITLDPSLLPEESSVDAAFLALGMHRYKSQPSTTTQLRQALDRTQNRFNFAAFACPSGWRMAYRYRTQWNPEGLVDLTYNGYTSEGHVISLAAHLQRQHHVPIDRYWNANVHRVRAELAPAQLARLDRPQVVHSSTEFRAPFLQVLLNLFVDLRQRGVDCYPDNRLAVNPWHNFVCYQQDVMTRLAAMGRPHFVQPDAGDDGTLNNYRQFSLYEDFGQHDLFMPWSSSFALLSGADRADAAFRFMLAHGLHGPFGLVDSARWETGQPAPTSVTSRADCWNTGLSTMALLEWLDGSARASRQFAELPEVRAALDQVFSDTPEIGRRDVRLAVDR